MRAFLSLLAVRAAVGAAVACLAAPVLGQPAGFSIQTVANGTGWAGGNEPNSLAFTPDGAKLFFTLRGGQTRWVALSALPLPAGNAGNLFATLPVTTGGELGLLGIAIDPDYATNGFVYVWQDLPAGGASIVRFTDVGGVGTSATTVRSGIPQTGIHNGGKIEFGPDGLLYFSVGDQASSGNSAITAGTNLAGKIHRIQKAPPGLAAPGNPFGNTIWSYGLRNNFGFTFSQVIPGVIYETEPGPSCNDELNRIVGGGWYGWTGACANTSLPGIPPILPLFSYPGVPTPTAVEGYYGSGFPIEFVGDIFTIEYSGGLIRKFDLRGKLGTGNPDDELVPGSGAPFASAGGSGFHAEMGPDGNLYFSTSSLIRRLVYTGALPNLAIGIQGTPALNRTIALHVNRGDAGSTGVVAFGVSTIPPLATPFGTLTVSPDIPLLLGVFGTNGVKTLVIGIPNDAALLGQVFHLQAAEIDPTGTSGNLSAAIAVTIV